MNNILRSHLELIYAEDVEWQQQNRGLAAQSHQAGDRATALDYSLHKRLPDTCWALERWDEARYWYRHNAQVFVERRLWHTAHSGPEYPLDELVDWEATTFIKAGYLRKGGTYLERAIAHWQQQTGAELILTELGLHAAQAGQEHLVSVTSAIVTARQSLLMGDDPYTTRAAQLLHYEPAQVALLLQQWDGLDHCLSQLEEANQLINEYHLDVFPEPLQKAILAAGEGLQHLLRLKTLRLQITSEVLSVTCGRAIAAFEQAMGYFYEFDQRLDYHLYFMRLNTRLARDMAQGQVLNPNPFIELENE